MASAPPALQAIVRDLGTVARRWEPAQRRMADQTLGWRSGAADGSGEHASQPERLAVPYVAEDGTDGPSPVHADQLEQDKRALRSALDVAANAVRVAASIVDRWSLCEEPDSHKNGPGGGLCRSCWRGDQACVPVVARYRRLGLCRWCGDWTATHKGRIPTMPILRAHHAGQRITVAAEARYARATSRVKVRRCA